MSSFVRRIALLVLGTALVGCGAPPTAEIPEIDTSTMEPRVAAAIESARENVRAKRDDASAWGTLGGVCHAHDLYDCARAGYEQAHRLDPAQFRWLYLLAMVREAQSADAAVVLDLYDEVAKLAPDYPMTYYRQGELLAARGDLDGARAAYGRALELDPNMAVAARGMGQVLLAEGDAPNAIRYLEPLARQGGSSRIFAALAQAYRQVGNDALAEEAQRRARATTRTLRVPDPVHAAIVSLGVSSRQLFEQAKSLAARGEWQQARERLVAVVETLDDNSSVHHYLGAAYARTGDPELALVHLERSVELSPESAGPRGELGRLLLELGRPADALPHLERLVEMKPDFERGREMLAQARAATGAP